MSVAQHLKIKLSEYDRRIRTFIPNYEEMLRAAAETLRLLRAPRPTIVDLGIGTGGLAARCLAVKPRALVHGIDSDEAILAMAQRRLAKASQRAHEFTSGDFIDAPLPRCHAITASLALHHIITRATKQQLYGRGFAALEPGGVFVNADCCPAQHEKLAQHAKAEWRTHLNQYYHPQQTRAFFASWAKEDTYFPLAVEIEMMQAAGFHVEVVWRRAPMAVVVGIKQ